MRRTVYTMPEDRIIGLRKKTFRDVLYIGICTTIAVSLIVKYQPQTSFVSPLPRVQAQELLNPMTGISMPVQEAETWEDFIKSAQKIAAIYNYPVKVIIAQAALESARGTSHYAKERNNYFGLGAYDWNPDNAFWYENQEQNIVDYMITIRANFPEAWNSRNDPVQLIKYLKENSQGNMYATDPNYVQKLMDLPEWSKY